MMNLAGRNGRFRTRIFAERYRQQQLFPTSSVAHDIGDLTRLMVLHEESGEVAKAVRRDLYPKDQKPANIREELIQVAAVCVAWLEAIDAAPRPAEAQAKGEGR